MPLAFPCAEPGNAVASDDRNGAVRNPVRCRAPNRRMRHEITHIIAPAKPSGGIHKDPHRVQNLFPGKDTSSSGARQGE
ncbi:hypothetical protein Apa02nite_005100 [Actinoplanes palleronii]|uniref:Uncharacterized protein n=1 Tax=Actinoplanes palleronii TaxID=113570 RepID=A0ABQ4B162_9ACTN|nr:hypothetical protein Apa02nite_005100 [Actinoplanes palleronii]